VIFTRPVNEAGERVSPSNLLEYRRTHDFKGPCCLCASLYADENAYTEASIFLAKSGPCTGKYVAACATGLCRYWGESILNMVPIVYLRKCWYVVSLENLYSQRGLLVRRFPLRGMCNVNGIIELYSNSMHNTPATANTVLPPLTPKAQSSATRELQDTERHIGSVVDHVVQDSQTSCTSTVNDWLILHANN
jgi:hypothetical protein